MPLLTTQSAKGYGFGNLVAAASGSGSFESIASTTLSATTSSVTFSSIPSTYQHLQVRMDLRDNLNQNGGFYYDMLFNNDSSSGYSYMYSETGSSVPTDSNWATGGNSSLTVAYGPYYPTANHVSSVFGPVILDVFDYSNPNKATTFTHVGGFTDGTYARLSQMAGHWLNNNVVNSISFTNGGGVYNVGCTFSLYGIKNS